VIEMAKHMKVGAMVTTGGTVLKDDIMRLQAPIHILVGTPGRVHDLADRGIANLSKCKIIVMDEADKLLSPEFQPSKCTCLHCVLLPLFFPLPSSIAYSSVPSLPPSLPPSLNRSLFLFPLSITLTPHLTTASYEPHDNLLLNALSYYLLLTLLSFLFFPFSFYLQHLRH
jgi:DEAD/DEAH box helicase